MRDPEETAVLAVLDQLGRVSGPDSTSVPEPEDEVEEVLRRLFHETSGLIPYALEPQPVSNELKAKVMHAAIGDSTQEVPLLEPAAAAPVAPAAPRERLAEPTAIAASVPGPDLRFTGTARRPRPRGLLAMAAVLALAVAGLGLLAAYLDSELRASRARLAWADREWRAEALAARSELSELRGQYDLVTAPAVSIFPLTCPTRQGPGANARVYLYLTPDKKRWDLAIHGLEPEPPDHDYQLWFLVGDRPQSAACFNMKNGRAVLSMTMSPPAGITGAAVTIEPRGGSPRPSTPVILQADREIRL